MLHVNSHRLICLVALLAMVFVTGCQSSKEVSEGKLKTPGVVIASEPGSPGAPFTITSGEIFKPPFQVDTLGMSDTPLSGLVEQWKQFEEKGGRRVKVTVPGVQQPLFGLLVLSKVHPQATGPASRMYLIEVPQQYVDAAQDGKISVVYEKVPYKDKEWFNWALWLSDRPLR